MKGALQWVFLIIIIPQTLDDTEVMPLPKI